MHLWFTVDSVWMSNLFVQPEHRAGHSDVSETDPLPHQEGTGVQVLVQHCKGPLNILLGLLCSLKRPGENKDLLICHTTHFAA